MICLREHRGALSEKKADELQDSNSSVRNQSSEYD